MVTTGLTVTDPKRGKTADAGNVGRVSSSPSCLPSASLLSSLVVDNRPLEAAPSPTRGVHSLYFTFILALPVSLSNANAKMLHEFLDKHFHRRLNGGLKRLNRRVYTPTIIWVTPQPTTAPAPTTTAGELRSSHSKRRRMGKGTVDACGDYARLVEPLASNLKRLCVSENARF